MSNEDVRRLSNDLVVLSARLVREVRRNAPPDMPPASMRVLSLLDELGPSTVSALAVADRCSQPTMTGLVGGLAEKGLVERRPHPDDARASLVTPTAAGNERLAAFRDINATLVAERFAGTDHDPADLATAVALLGDLT